MKKIIVFSAISVIILVIIILLVRANSEIGLDDVSPGIECDEKLMEKADVLYIIPKYENMSIAEDKEWCEKILAMNKTLALHGVYHTYEEFGAERDESYLQGGIDSFNKCFGYNPERFKPPQMKISEKSKEIVMSKMQLDYYIDSALHKAYHCGNTGYFSNKFMDLI